MEQPSLGGKPHRACRIGPPCTDCNRRSTVIVSKRCSTPDVAELHRCSDGPLGDMTLFGHTAIPGDANCALVRPASVNQPDL